MTDTLFPDVSEYQCPVDDSFTDAGFRFISIRSNDGTYRDQNFAQNYEWCKKAADDGRIDGFIVYFVTRPNWEDTLLTHKIMLGEIHPKCVSMMDVESWGGQISGDCSDWINKIYWGLADHYGNRDRIIAYLNPNDWHIWQTRPDVKFVIPSYGAAPNFSPGGVDLPDLEKNMIAHQYTDGEGFGNGLPEGTPPFGKCDMNAANGLSSAQLAEKLGIGTTPEAPVTQPVDKLEEIHHQIVDGWPQLGQTDDGLPLTLVDSQAAQNNKLDKIIEGLENILTILRQGSPEEKV